MSGLMKTALVQLRPAANQLVAQKATHFTYGPPRYRMALNKKLAIFGVVLFISQIPMLLTVKLVPTYATKKDD